MLTNPPSDWIVCDLEALATVERGKFSVRPRNDPRYFGGATPFIQTGDITSSHGYIERHTQTLNELGVSVSRVFPAGTIMTTIAANIGDFAIAAYPVACPDSVVGIEARAGVDTFWLYSVLTCFKPALDRASTQSAQKNINLQTLRPLQIPVPPLDEQRRIAEVLRSVDGAIAAAQDVIIQLREVRSHRLDAFMVLPGAYRRIEDVCRLSGGNGFPIKHQGKASGRYPFAKVSDMNRPGNEVLMRNAENYVDDADLRALKAKTFPVGTTFFPKVGATLLTNKRRISAVEMLVDNNVMGAVATGIDPWFLYYAFCTIDMADYVQPGAVPSVNQRTIGQIMIPVPSKSEQERFAQSMRDLDLAIEAQSDALGQLRQSKGMIAADLLSGHVRVPA